MTKIKKPIAPNKPHKPVEPTEPEEYGYFQAVPIGLGIDMDYETTPDYYDSYSVEASITIKDVESLYESVTDFKSKHPNVRNVKIDLVYSQIQYEEYGRNPCYDRNIKSYNKYIAEYKRKLVEYKKKNEKYLTELEEYNKLKLQYDLQEAKLNLKRLEEKASE